MKRYVTAALAGVISGTMILTGCGSSPGKTDESAKAPADVDTSAPVSITVQGLAPGAEADAQAALAEQVAAFQEKHTNITVKTEEWQWDVQTFASQLAGGTLPTVFQVPFTDGRTLLENQQVYPIDEFAQTLPYYGKFNETVGAAGQDSDGKQWMIPTMAYGMGLTYNRDLFEQAGLDPDKPPTTWDEIREYAKTIAEKTGQSGYSQMTKDGTGGWILTTVDYSLGGRIEAGTPDDVTVDVNSDSIKKQLEMLKAMRWEDNSMGANQLHDWGSINADFAAGKIGMFVGGSDLLEPMIQMNQINEDIYGLTMIPTEGDNSGVLGGGALAAVSAKATPEQAAAAVAWIDFYYVSRLGTEEGAVADAKIREANGQPIGIPGFPVFDEQTYQDREGWLKPYMNVPLEQMTGYTSKMFDVELISEPAVKTQELYAAMAPMVQEVLSNKDVDIDQLLEQYQSVAESTVK